jgi:hypothetical protein
MSWFGLLIFLVWLSCFASTLLGLRKAPSRLERWADRNGLKIMDREQPGSFNSPFTKRTTAQSVYRVAFEDNQGRRRLAWAMCGSPLLGSWSDQVEVRWDKDGGPSDVDRRWLDSPAMIRHRRETIVVWGFRYLLVGVGVGLGVGFLLLLLAGGPLDRVIVPFLAISSIIGAIVGGVSGGVGGVIHARLKAQQREKYNDPQQR